jgi:hypothetical protein
MNFAIAFLRLLQTKPVTLYFSSYALFAQNPFQLTFYHYYNEHKSLCTTRLYLESFLTSR